MTITLPTHFSDNFGDPIKQLFKILSELHNLSLSSITLVYDDATFTHPFFTLALPLIRKMYARKGVDISLSAKFNRANVKEYMDCIKFPDGVNPEIITGTTFSEYFSQFKSKTYVPMINFPTVENNTSGTIRNNFTSAIEEIIIRQAGFSGQLLSSLKYLIAEAVDNIVEHAQDERGYILAQVYNQKNYMDICIADIGRTLLETYSAEARFSTIDTHKKAMEAALTGKSTKSNNVDRGFGISSSKKMLTEGLNGKYFIFSGNAFNIHTTAINNVVELPGHTFWQGVYIAMRIPLVARGNFRYTDYIE